MKYKSTTQDNNASAYRHSTPMVSIYKHITKTPLERLLANNMELIYIHSPDMKTSERNRQLITTDTVIERTGKQLLRGGLI